MWQWKYFCFTLKNSSLFLRVIWLPVVSACSTPSFYRAPHRAQISRALHGRVPGRGAGSGGRRGAEEPRQEAAGALLQGADLRAGAPLPAAALPVRPGEGAPGRAHPPHPEPGEDLVPEPPLQDEAGPGGAQPGGAAAAARPQGGHPGPGAGRETVRPDHGAGPGGDAQVRPEPASVCVLSAAAPRLRPGPPRPAPAAPRGAAAGAHVPLELVKRNSHWRGSVPKTQMHLMNSSSALKWQLTLSWNINTSICKVRQVHLFWMRFGTNIWKFVFPWKKKKVIFQKGWESWNKAESVMSSQKI